MPPQEDDVVAAPHNSNRLLVFVLCVAALGAWFRALFGGPLPLYGVAVLVFLAALTLSGGARRHRPVLVAPVPPELTSERPAVETPMMPEAPPPLAATAEVPATHAPPLGTAPAEAAAAPEEPSPSGEVSAALQHPSAVEPPALAEPASPIEPCAPAEPPSAVEPRAPAPAPVRRRAVPVPSAAPVWCGPTGSVDDPTAAVVALLDAFAPHPPLAVHLWLRDGASQSMRRLAAAGTLLPEPHPLPLEDDPVGIAAAGEGLTSAAVASVRLGLETHTMWRHAFPFATGEMRAVVAVDTVPEHAPHPERVAEVLAFWAPTLSSVVAGFLEETQRAEGRELLEAISLLAAASTAEQVIDVALSAATRMTGAASGSVMLADPDGRTLRIVAAKGLPQSLGDAEVPFGEGISGWVAASGQPMLVEDLPGRNEVRRSRSRSSMSVPIQHAGRVIGVLNAGCRDYPGVPMGPRLDALVLLGRQAAIALDALSPAVGAPLGNAPSRDDS